MLQGRVCGETRSGEGVRDLDRLCYTTTAAASHLKTQQYHSNRAYDQTTGHLRAAETHFMQAPAQ